MLKGKLKIKIKGDKVIWMIFILLMLISCIEVYSTIGKTVYEKQGGSPFGMFAKHIAILCAGTCLVYVVHTVKYTLFSRWAKSGLFFSYILLIITLLIGSIGTKSAARWLTIPLIGQFQPSEIVKIVLIVYVARTLALHQDKIKSLDVFKRLLLPILLTCALIFPENFSTAAILFLICFCMMFIGGINLKYIGMLLGVGVLVIVVGFTVMKSNPNLLARSDTWVKRIESFTNNDMQAITQSNQARMAIATGGIVGKMVGNTTQARFLSESHNDFIFSIIIEEGGIFLGLLVIILYLVLLYRGILIARRCKGFFGAFCSIGVVMMIVFQAMINMCVSVSLMPVTGQTLPFISYGGTSFIFSCVALGIVLSISAETNKEYEQEALATDVDTSLDDKAAKAVQQAQENNQETQQDNNTQTT